MAELVTGITACSDFLPQIRPNEEHSGGTAMSRKPTAISLPAGSQILAIALGLALSLPVFCLLAASTLFAI